MQEKPVVIHIDIGNQSLTTWVKENKYIIHSELIRYSEKMIKEDIDVLQAVMVSNLVDNVVFILKKDSLSLTLEKSMEYFMSIEEYEKCAKIRDLEYLLKNQKNETKNTKDRK
jgi:hypothetical protein